MRINGGVVRLTICAVCCLTIILYSGYDRLFDTRVTTQNLSAAMPLELPTANTEDESSVAVDTSVKNTSEAHDSSSSQATDTANKDDGESVEAKAEGTALGGVVEKFISPYTANTSYNSVYLKNSTDLTIDLKSLLAASLPYKIEKNSSPQVLIVHTHTTEAFLHEDRDYYTDADLSRTLDENYNMVRLGEIVTSRLNGVGINTLHDTTTHDYPEYNGSYDRAAKTINSYLKKYPSIKIVIDMHRDAISGDGSDKVKPVTEINGRKAAQVMFVMGSQSGSVTNHPNWKENLKLAVRLQQQMEIMYPTLARSISLMPRLYNQNLTTGSLLLEIGTEANSIDEVTYSAELVSDVLVKVLNTLG